MTGTLHLSAGTQFCLSGAAISDRSRNPHKVAIRAFTETAPVPEKRRTGSLYEVLRVKRNASVMEIKTAYRSLAKLHHPDASPPEESDGRDFIEIHKAYATLSDPAARALYDLSLSIGQVRGPFRYASGDCSGYYSTTRRWETDQCW